MRLLFINPPNITRFNRKFIEQGQLVSPENTSFPPLGIGYLAAVAEKLGHECKVFDLNVVCWPSERQIKDFSPDLLLLSTLTLQYRAAKIIISRVKGNAPIVVGGPHPSIFKEKILADGMDIVAVGEGENTILSILKNFPDSLGQVPGIIFRKNGNIINTGYPRPLDDLDILPFPAWHYFDLNLYENIYYGRKCLPIISSRGCPYQCIYCFKGVFGDKIRLRSAKNIFQEIVFLKEKYNIGAVQFQDDLFTIKKSRIEEFCQLLIDNKLDIIWRCLSRADQVDFELLRLMHRAGCKSIAFGIESGSQEMLDRIGKKMNLEQANKAIRACNEIGIVSKGYYIIGLPGETHKSAKETIEFARKNRTTQLQFTLPVAYPGTKLWDIGKRMGLPVEDYVESFAWDESLPPYSFTDYLNVNELQYYVLTARSIGSLQRLLKMLSTIRLREFPGLLKRIFAKLILLLKINIENKI